MDKVQENITMDEQKPDTWTGCYDLGWGDLLVPAAYSHPAKMSRSLVFKIIAHALEENWIQPGQTILDPFGGVGTTALPTLMAGLNYIGCELEPRFVELGRQNIALWNSRFSGMPKWTGQATLLQGDSRRLAEVVQGAGLVISSPPYVGGGHHNDQTGAWGGAVGTGQPTGKDKSVAGYGQGNGQMGQMKEGDIQAVISSPPFAGNSGGRGEASRNGIDAALFDRHSGGMKKGTGSDPANLDHLPMGTPPMAIVSSPPYASGEKGHPSLGSVNKDDWGNEGTDIAGRRGVNGDYGKSSGQLAEMPEGQVSAVVGSPPFENSIYADDRKTRGNLYNGLDENGQARGGKFGDVTYGSTDGQIGATQGDTFWAAARLIVEQCALLLPPNGAAIWVVKNYVKGGVEVQFSEQWRQLCEACGFETVHIHRAMLVKENEAQSSMFGADKKNKVERKSFFRRLSEAAKKAEVHWETLSNEDRVALIAAAYVRLFEHYLAKLRELGEKKPAAITKSRLMREAKSKAWLRDGRPDYEIATSINWETVLCMRKAA